MCNFEGLEGPNVSPPQSYDVGYGRPPKAHRFKKGQSGNPAGARKHKTLTLQSVLEDSLAEPIVARTNGKERRMTGLEAMVWAQMQAALHGNPKALKYILDLMKQTSRFTDHNRFRGGVVTYEDTESEDAKDLAEFRALKAAGKNPDDYFYEIEV